MVAGGRACLKKTMIKRSDIRSHCLKCQARVRTGTRECNVELRAAFRHFIRTVSGCGKGSLRTVRVPISHKWSTQPGKYLGAGFRFTRIRSHARARFRSISSVTGTCTGAQPEQTASIRRSGKFLQMSVQAARSVTASQMINLIILKNLDCTWSSPTEKTVTDFTQRHQGRKQFVTCKSVQSKVGCAMHFLESDSLRSKISMAYK
jgi:hypothetical protein